MTPARALKYLSTGALALLGEAEGTGFIQHGGRRATCDPLIAKQLVKTAAFWFVSGGCQEDVVRLFSVLQGGRTGVNCLSLETGLPISDAFLPKDSQAARQVVHRAVQLPVWQDLET